MLRNKNTHQNNYIQNGRLSAAMDGMAVLYLTN